MKTKKRTLTVLLIVTMILSSFSFAFAAETPSGSVHASDFVGGTITINASNADDSFKVYKVVDITYDANGNVVNFAFTSNAATYASAKGVTLDTYRSYGDNSAKLNAFLGGYAAYVKEKGIAANYTATASGGIATIPDVAMGQYVVVGAGSATGAYVYQVMSATFKPDEDLNVNTAVALSSKATEPSITKDVANKDYTVAVGDEITYKIEVTVPTYPDGATNRAYTVKDVLPTGLTYKANSAEVKIGDTTYSGATFTANDQNLTWDFKKFDEIKAASTIEITYVAVAGKDMTITTGNENTASLIYSNDPYGERKYTKTAKVKVYTYGLEIEKVDQDSKKPLAGVVFDVYKADKTTKVGTITTDAEGKASLAGLDLGDYYLKETKAADGYNLPALDYFLKVEVKDSDINGILDDDNDGIAHADITNTKGAFNLPSTGGMGTWIFTIAGICLMAVAAAGMMIIKRRQVRA